MFRSRNSRHDHLLAAPWKNFISRVCSLSLFYRVQRKDCRCQRPSLIITAENIASAVSSHICHSFVQIKAGLGLKFIPFVRSNGRIRVCSHDNFRCTLLATVSLLYTWHLLCQRTSSVCVSDDTGIRDELQCRRLRYRHIRDLPMRKLCESASSARPRN